MTDVAESAAITHEGVARLRQRIGIVQPHPQPPHYLRPNEDAFRHVADAYGDDNPLWCDPSYGETTRRGGPMSDDAWLWKLDCEFRKFNYVGDTHWMRGRVTRKYLADGDRPAVECDIRGENQRGETTTRGHATILLPSRERGEVRLPDPPGGATTCQEALDALIERFAAMG